MLDSSEVHALAAQLHAAPARVMMALVPVAHTAGNKIKGGIRRNASGHRRLPHLARTVEYDLAASASEVRVDVGFRKEGQGNLAWIAVYGQNDQAPFVDIDTQLADEVKPFMRWVAKVGGEVL